MVAKPLSQLKSLSQTALDGSLKYDSVSNNHLIR